MNFVGKQRQIEILKKHFPIIYGLKHEDDILKMFFEFENSLKELDNKDFEIRKCAMIEDELMHNTKTTYKYEDLQLLTNEILNQKIKPLNEKKFNRDEIKSNRYVIESWGDDYGIYDTVNKEFIGVPYSTHREALAVLNFLKSI